RSDQSCRAQRQRRQYLQLGAGFDADVARVRAGMPKLARDKELYAGAVFGDVQSERRRKYTGRSLAKYQGSATRRGNAGESYLNGRRQHAGRIDHPNATWRRGPADKSSIGAGAVVDLQLDFHSFMPP